MLDILETSGAQVIQNRDLIALVHQRFTQMGPNKPGAAGY
jgi:hypothetical protein